MDIQHQFFWIMSFVLGLMLGSFATMASYRLPRHEDWIVTPSHCPVCQHRLGVLDLFPVFSWCVHLGKCRHCHAKVSIRYPLIELTMGGLFAIVFWHTGMVLETILLWAIIVAIVIETVITIERRQFPNSLFIFLIVCAVLRGMLLEIIWLEVVYGAFVALVLAIIFYQVCKWFKAKNCFSETEVKWFFLAGLFLGIKGMAPFLSLFAFVVMAHALFLILFRKEQYFMPAVVVSVLLVVCLIIPQ